MVFQAKEAWLVKVLALKSSQLSLIPGIPVWNKRTEAYKLLSDLHMCAVHVHTIISTKKKFKMWYSNYVSISGSTLSCALALMKKPITFSRLAKRLEA